MKTIVTATLYLLWIAIGYLGLRQAGRRFFSGPYRAEVAAAAIVVAFALGISWPHANSAEVAGSPPPVAVAPAAPPPAAAARVTDVAKACAEARLSAAAGKGNVDAGAVVTGGTEVPAGPLPEVHKGDTFVLRGWAANSDLNAPTAAACIIMDGKVVVATTGVYGGNRPDVAAAFNSPSLVPTGFQLLVAASAIPLGRHRIQAAAVAADGTASVIAGSRALISTR